MMNFFRKHMKIIFSITAVGFIGGIFVGFGGYFFSRSPVTDTIAEVNGVKIPYRHYRLLFSRVMDNLRDSDTEITDQLIKQKQDEVIQDLIQEEVFWQEAKKYDIRVSDDEVALNISQFPAFQQDGKFSQALYFQVLAWRLRMTANEFEESRRRQIAIAKLRSLITSGVKITDKELVDEYLQKHEGKLTDFEEKKDEFYISVIQEKTLAVLNEWYRTINANLKVKLYKDRI